MAIVYRLLKGAPLTFQEGDDNWRWLVQNAGSGGTGVYKDINDLTLTVGDLVTGKKAGINDGSFFIGYVTIAPPTTDAHIKFEYRN